MNRLARMCTALGAVKSSFRCNRVYYSPLQTQSFRAFSGTDKSSTDMPSTDMPSTDMPSTDMPSTDMPSTDMPSTNMPRRFRPRKPVSFFIETSDGNKYKISGHERNRLLDLLYTHIDLIGFDYGQCKGQTSCSTCHVIFTEEMYSKLPAPTQNEENILMSTIDFEENRSRLGCAVCLSLEWEGITIRMPRRRLDIRNL